MALQMFGAVKARADEGGGLFVARLWGAPPIFKHPPASAAGSGWPAPARGGAGSRPCPPAARQTATRHHVRPSPTHPLFTPPGAQAAQAALKARAAFADPTRGGSSTNLGMEGADEVLFSCCKREAFTPQTNLKSLFRRLRATFK